MSALNIDKQHWLNGARRSLSPHRDARPNGLPSILVIHAISLPPGQFAGQAVEQLFLGTLDTASDPAVASLAGVRVSAHLFIRRNGELVQFVPFDERAWHAGRSHWQGLDGLNDYAVGIELEGDSQQGYTYSQYRGLAQASWALSQRYPNMTLSRTVGHEYIAPYRKEDPGPGFDWQLFAQLHTSMA